MDYKKSINGFTESRLGHTHFKISTTVGWRALLFMKQLNPLCDLIFLSTRRKSASQKIFLFYHVANFASQNIDIFPKMRRKSHRVATFGPHCIIIYNLTPTLIYEVLQSQPPTWRICSSVIFFPS